MLIWEVIDLHPQGEIQFKIANFFMPEFSTKVNTQPQVLRHKTHEFHLPRQLHGPDCFMVSILYTYSST